MNLGEKAPEDKKEDGDDGADDLLSSNCSIKSFWVFTSPQRCFIRFYQVVFISNISQFAVLFLLVLSETHPFSVGCFMIMMLLLVEYDTIPSPAKMCAYDTLLFMVPEIIS